MINPFKSLGDLKNAAGQMMKIQRELENTQISVQKGEVEVTVSADMKVKNILVSGEEKRDIREAVNEALEKAKKEAAGKMKNLGGGLGGFLK